MDLMRRHVAALITTFCLTQTSPSFAFMVDRPLEIRPGAELNQQSAMPLQGEGKALRDLLDADKSALGRELNAYYAASNYKYVWTEGGRFNEKAEDVIARLSNARYDGLIAEDYIKPAFSKASPATSDSKAQALAEYELSKSCVSFVRHLSTGRIDPSSLRLLSEKRAPASARKILEDFAAGKEAAQVIASYEPQHAGYQALRTELAQALDGETPSLANAKPVIPSGPVLAEGMSDERVPILRTRFALSAGDTGKTVMDAELGAAIRAFQKENDLKATGKLNRLTLAALNRQANAKPSKGHVQVDDLVVNMEKWRWLPRELGQMNVMVNIPEFLVRVNRDNKTIYEGRVVVGKADTPTPIFSNAIQYIVVNPSWNVPQSIVDNEMMPMLQRNPEEFYRRGYEVTQDKRGKLHFRQPPSERNALGRVKFMFPNDHNVYLHDTPAKGYFARTVRAFSHGCVRVGEPMKFANALLVQEKGMSAKSIQKLYGGEERYMNLKTPVPVHIVYFTAFADEDGILQHRADVYGVDRRMKSLLGLS